MRHVLFNTKRADTSPHLFECSNTVWGGQRLGRMDMETPQSTPPSSDSWKKSWWMKVSVEA